MIQKVLADKIPQWQEDIKSNLKDKGDKVVGDVTVAQAYGGMRGIIGLTCETSSVSPDKGLMIRERPISEITHLLPEEVFYLLLTGEIPNSEENPEPWTTSTCFSCNKSKTNCLSSSES